MTIQATRLRPGPTYRPGERPCDRCGITYEPGKDKLPECSDCLSLKCANGHDRNEENTYMSPGGQRGCIPCRVDARRKFTERRAARKRAAAVSV